MILLELLYSGHHPDVERIWWAILSAVLIAFTFIMQLKWFKPFDRHRQNLLNI